MPPEIGGDPALAAARDYPALRWMGSKLRLLPFLAATFREIEFDSAIDAFSGSGCVSYLLKRMGKQVLANDAMRVATTFAEALVVNDDRRIGPALIDRLARLEGEPRGFITRTFAGIFYTPADLAFLDAVWAELDRDSALPRAMILAALARAALKRQPRGVFTVAGDPESMKDGRRDLRLDLRQQFRENAALLDATVFASGRRHEARFGEVFELEGERADLVYLDPPYVPRADDNCYIKRYHFVEGLVSCWRAPEAVIREDSKVKKLVKRRSPFGSKKTASAAFDRLFGAFPGATLVLSYSSNGWPDLDLLVAAMRRHRSGVEVKSRPHRYSFGTHGGVAAERRTTEEYLIVGR